MADRPKRIDVQWNPPSDFSFTVDGEPFPFAVSSLTHTISAQGWPVVIVEIEADEVTTSHHMRSANA